MQQTFATLLANYGVSALVSAAVAGAIVWFSKTFITERLKAAVKASYDEKLESVKAGLKAESDAAIEKLKHELQLTAAERQLKLAKLHERRAIVVADTFSSLSETYDALKGFTSAFELAGGPTKVELGTTLSEAQQNFYQTYSRQRIFLPKEVASQLELINKSIVGAATSFSIRVVHNRDSPDQTRVWMEVLEQVEGPINAALTDLEDEMRKLMGVL